jgi:hypothetical protein
MLNFQAKQLCACSSDILNSAEGALQNLEKFDYCAYLKREDVYPHLRLISAHDLATKQLELFLNHYKPHSIIIFKDIIKEKDAQYTCFSIPLTPTNFQWIQNIFQSKPHFFEVQDTFSDLIHDLPKQFLSHYQNAPSYELFQQVVAYSQYEPNSKHLWSKGKNLCHISNQEYTLALQHIVINDPLAIFFIQGTQRLVINELLIEPLKTILNEDPNALIHRYLERLQQEEPESLPIPSFNEDIHLCAVFFEHPYCSIFSEFEFKIFNTLNQPYKKQLHHESFKQRMQHDAILKDLYLPRFEQLLNLIHGENRWNISIENSGTQPANPYLDCWQSGLFLQPLHVLSKDLSYSEKFKDPQLSTHLLSLPYGYFQILVLYFNCLHNPRLINHLIETIDDYLTQQKIQTIPHVIIEKIEKKYPEKASKYSNINQQFYESHVLPELKHVLLQNAKHVFKKMLEQKEHQVNIPVYDKRFHSFTMIRLDNTQPLSYLIDETLQLENPERFHAHWVLNKLKSDFNQNIHPQVVDEFMF